MFLGAISDSISKLVLPFSSGTIGDRIGGFSSKRVNGLASASTSNGLAPRYPRDFGLTAGDTAY